MKRPGSFQTHCNTCCNIADCFWGLRNYTNNFNIAIRSNLKFRFFGKRSSLVKEIHYYFFICKIYSTISTICINRVI